MNKKLYKLMDWAAIEAIEYAEEDQPQKILGAHVVGNAMLHFCGRSSSAVAA